MNGQYQDAITLINELLSDKGKEKEIEELRKALAEPGTAVIKQIFFFIVLTIYCATVLFIAS